MALVKVLRAGQVTLPASIREALEVAEGDYLEAELVGRSVVLRPLADGDRAKVWRKIREAQAAVRYIGPEPRPTPDEEERTIFEEVDAFRHRK
jgi:AbrB family looped-hinge helix DNA binding protein